MIIDDQWFTKSMLVKAMADTSKAQSQGETKVPGSENPFFTLFNELLKQQEVENQNQPAPRFIPQELGVRTNLYQANFPINQYRYQQGSQHLSFHDVSSDKINQMLSGKLAGMGDTFVQAGQQYNIDPALLVAIAQHETGNGTSRAATEKNNIAGMMGKNGLKTYASVEESILDMARNLRKNYLGKGLASLAEIGAKYAPVGAENDSTGLNNHWVTGVSQFLNKIRV